MHKVQTAVERGVVCNLYVNMSVCHAPAPCEDGCEDYWGTMEVYYMEVPVFLRGMQWRRILPAVLL